MPSRVPSSAVLQALRRYDRRLSIEWDDAFAGWRLVYDGCPQRAILCHADGTPLGDLYVGEVLHLVRQQDRHNHQGRWERDRAKWARWRRDADAKVREEGLDEASAEARQALQTLRRGGPRPFVHLSSKKERSHV